MTDFGRDISCLTSLNSGRFSTGARLVGEACYRRLTTPRGALRGADEEANYGIDLSELVGTVNPRSAASTLPGRIASELSKDERIESVDVEILVVTEGPETSFEISIEATTGAGPFTLKIAASAVTVELLGLETE